MRFCLLACLLAAVLSRLDLSCLVCLDFSKERGRVLNETGNATLTVCLSCKEPHVIWRACMQAAPS